MKQKFYSITKKFKYHNRKCHAFRIKNDFVNAAEIITLSIGKKYFFEKRLKFKIV